MQIYLVQHGACLEKTINPERPLSKEGRKDMEHLCLMWSPIRKSVSTDKI